MPEKNILLLGDIAHEGLTSALSTAGYKYKTKLLNTSIDNWKSILKVFQQAHVSMIIGKITGDTYERIVRPEYQEIATALLKSISERPHRLFAYEDLLAGEPQNDSYYASTSKDVLLPVNQLFKEHKIDILPYKKRAEVTVSAQSFLKEVNEGLLFRLYVPSGRLWGEEMGKLLGLFKDYLTKVAGLSVRLDQQSTSKGIIYAFHGASFGSNQNAGYGLAKHFEDFQKLTDLCVSNPSAAEDVLKSSGINTKEIIQIISRYSKEFRRLQLDLKHSREEKVLAIRHQLESELVDLVSPEQMNSIQIAVDTIIPNVTTTFPTNVLLLPRTAKADGIANITLNISPQYIDRVEGVVAQEINGIAHLTSQDNALISAFQKFGGSKAPELTSALQEVNDTSVPEADRVTAKQRIKQFIFSVADKMGDAAAGVFQTYIEKKFLGE